MTCFEERVMRTMLLFTLAVLMLAGNADASRAQSPRPSSLAVRVDSVFAPWDKTSSPGCVVAVSRNGTLLYERGYGMANLEYGLAITPASIFHVASISKQFTAMSVGMLAQRGKLSLDDDVRKYITELPDYGTRITIRHLLTHTSGLRDQWSLLALAGWREDDLITQEDVLRIVARQKSLNFPPGSEYLYSNTGFTLLAVIVKRVSGQSLREFADSNIFRPLGMTHTHFHDDHTMIVPNRTSAYQPRPGGGWRVSIPVFDTYGATSLFTTAGDLLLWERNFADARVGGRELLAAMETPTLLTNGDTSFYGLGLTLGRYRGARTFGHGGADAGYRADVVLFPEQALAIAALCNLSNINPNSLTRRVADIYLRDVLPATVTSPTPAVVAVPLSADQLARVAGLYRNPLTDAVQRISVRDGNLVLGPGAAPGAALTPVSPTRFLNPGGANAFEFTPATGARPTEMRIVAEGQKPVMFEQVAPFTPSAAELRAFAGEYASPELETSYTLVVSDTVLVVRTRKAADVPLRPTFADAFQASIGIIRFTRDARGTISGFTVNTGRVRSLRFDRIKG
jgi:CubicO group peptidase (beta-lactamase class C family)